MKQVIGLVLLGLLCGNAVLADGNGETQADGASQSGRIVNGIGVNIVNYPFALSLRFDGQFFCGASIITPSHALTAGHCMDPIKYFVSRVTLRGGSTSATSGGFLFRASKIAVHPNYNPNSSPGTSDFDVAIVTVLTNAFRGRPNMVPIQLQNSEVPTGSLCNVVGWGRTNINALAPAGDLRYANMTIVSQAICEKSWASFPAQRVTSNMICSKYSNGVDVCKGDGGGSLVCGGRLTGIVSFTNPNCNSAWPAGFAKVVAPSIRSFIYNQTGISI